MPALSNYAESGLLNWLFRSNSNNFSRPNVLAVALTRNVPNESDNGSNMNEIANAGSYARVSLGAPTNATWTEVNQDASSSGTLDNVSAITFPVATADWGWASGMAIVTSGVYGAGEILMFGALPTPKLIQVNDQFTFAIGNIDIFLG